MLTEALFFQSVLLAHYRKHMEGFVTKCKTIFPQAIDEKP